MNRRRLLVGAATVGLVPTLSGCSRSGTSEASQKSGSDNRIERDGAGPMTATPISVHPRYLLLRPETLQDHWVSPQDSAQVRTDGDVGGYPIEEGEQATSASMLVRSTPAGLVQIAGTTTVFETPERSQRAYDHAYENSRPDPDTERVERYWEDAYGDESYHYTVHIDEYRIGVSEIRVANAVASLQVYMQVMDDVELENQLRTYNARLTSLLTGAK